NVVLEEPQRLTRVRRGPHWRRRESNFRVKIEQEQTYLPPELPLRRPADLSIERAPKMFHPLPRIAPPVHVEQQPDLSSPRHRCRRRCDRHDAAMVRAAPSSISFPPSRDQRQHGWVTSCPTRRAGAAGSAYHPVADEAMRCRMTPPSRRLRWAGLSSIPRGWNCATRRAHSWPCAPKALQCCIVSCSSASMSSR